MLGIGGAASSESVLGGSASCCADLDPGWKRERRVGQRGQGIDSFPDAIA